MELTFPGPRNAVYKIRAFHLDIDFLIRKAISKWQLGVYNNDNDDVDDKGAIKLGVD